VAAEVTAAGLAGGIASFLLLGAFDPFGQIGDKDVLVAVVLGVLAGIGINRFLRSGS
jgi:hypothetical protein